MYRHTSSLFSRTVSCLSVLAGLMLLSPLPSVQAGCGCTKAPPAPAAVRPHATYAGADVTLFAPALQVGQSYEVTFTSLTGARVTVQAEAVFRRDLADAVQKPQLTVSLPTLPLGPVSTVVRPAGQASVVLRADDSALTVVPQPLPLPTNVGLTTIPDFQAAVGRDGTVYVSLDVSAIHMPRTFKAQALGYPLRFTNDEVVFYNVQGFVMQLLEEGMPGLFAIDTASGEDSDVLNYSRHEFNTHFLQHAERQRHAVDATDGNWHQDKTPHIDHDHLVVAIAGFLADGSLPLPGATPAFDLVLNTYTFFHDGLVGDASVALSGGSQTRSYNSQDDSIGSAGDVRSNGSLSVTEASLIDGDALAFDFAISDNSQLTGHAILATEPTEFLPVEMPTGLEDLGKIVIKDGTTVTVEPGSYRVSCVEVAEAGSQVFIDNAAGPVTLYATGCVKGDGKILAVNVTDLGTITAADPDPEKFAIYVVDGSVKIKNEGLFSGVVYAPTSLVKARGSRFFGAFVGHEVTIVEGAAVYYDTALRGSHSSDGQEATSLPTDATTSDGVDSPSAAETPAPPATDTVQMTKAAYVNKKDELVVFAESEAAPDATLTVSIAGFVDHAPMTYKAKRGRYEYRVNTSVNLDGQQVTVTSDFGGTASQTIQ